MPDQPETDRDKAPTNNLSSYAGRWVALLGERVVGQGGTPDQAFKAAQADRFKEIPRIIFIPSDHPVMFPDILERVVASLPSDMPVYLVGGAVRDALLGRASHDLDFILPGEAIPLGRSLARTLGAAFYPLDEERDTARLFLKQPDGNRYTLDFARLRGPDLESDLRARDFTINAMAVEVRKPMELLDPLGGDTDLRSRHLHACSPTSLSDDPIRILRAVRQAAVLNFHILPETRSLMRQAISLLPNVSPERLRDELFRILDGPRPDTSMRALDILGALPFILPELTELKGVEQPPPHIADVWQHTLDVLNKLDGILDVLDLQYNPAKAANLNMGLVAIRLGRYRQPLSKHLEISLNVDRPIRPLLFLAALYHDVSKPQTRKVDDQGRIRFLGHAQMGAETITNRARLLKLSNPEINRLYIIVRHHLRPLLLGNLERAPSRRAIYRFFRDTGEAGVDICLLSLADVLATYETTLPQNVWNKHLDIIRILLEAWWEHPEERVSPPIVLNGDDLITRFNLAPGPRIGQLLEVVREAQVTGQIESREEAFLFVKKYLTQKDESGL